jgi:trimethylamine--corrinoid protein Co-methyltransferase
MATIEKWGNGYLPFMAGANVNGGAGSLACVGTVSLQQLVIDNDVYGHFFRHMQGLALDDESLAAEVIARVGPGNAYLADEHTLAHFRSEYYRSPLANRLSAPAWEAAGSHDALAHASDAVRQILSAAPHDYLSEDQSREIASLLAKAEASLANLEVHV